MSKKRVFGIVLVIFGIMCIAYPFIEIKMDSKNIEKNISEWDKQKVQVIKEMDNNKEVKNNKENKKQTVKVDGKDIVGKIIVLKNGEEIPILFGANTENLRYGATIYDNGIMPGDKGTVIILGHRETTFAFLEHINKEDEIEIETLNGTYKYKVEKTFITNPEDERILEQRKGNNLTLVTCYPFRYVGPAPDRFIVNLKQIN